MQWKGNCRTQKTNEEPQQPPFQNRLDKYKYEKLKWGGREITKPRIKVSSRERNVPISKVIDMNKT